MKKISKFVWVLALSIPPALSTDSMNTDKNSSTERKVLCKSEGWENGKKIWEKVEYISIPPKEPILPSGMGAWESGNLGIVEQNPQTILYNGQEY